MNLAALQQVISGGIAVMKNFIVMINGEFKEITIVKAPVWGGLKGCRSGGGLLGGGSAR